MTNSDKDRFARQLIAWSIVLLISSACAPYVDLAPRMGGEVGAPTGPRCTPESTMPADKATVYMYRTSGSGRSYTVSANLVPLAPIPNQGYFVFHAPAGRMELSAAILTRSSVTVDTKAGETYDIKATIRPGFPYEHPHLELVSNDVGAKEMLGCKLVMESTLTIPRNVMALGKVEVPNDEGSVTTYPVHWFSGIKAVADTENLELNAYAVDGAAEYVDGALMDPSWSDVDVSSSGDRWLERNTHH